MTDPTNLANVNGSAKIEGNEMQRLSSFKSPRDLTLGGTKAPKKVFTPNLNVIRNKRGSHSNSPFNKKEFEKQKKDRNKNVKNLPNIIKSSGVFSEGIAASEKHHVRSSYGRESETTSHVQKSFIRVKEPWKIDRELEEENIKQGFGNIKPEDEDEGPIDLKDAPIRLPISAGGNLYSVRAKEPTKLPLVKIEIKEEQSETETPEEVKPIPKFHLPEPTGLDLEPSVGSILKSEKPRLILLQLPDNLPGRGGEDDSRIRNKQNETDENRNVDDRCQLMDLEEGKIGKIQIHKSGKVKMQLGDTTFDLSLGTLPCFRQDIVSVATDQETKSGVMINLGGVDNKLTVIPDWETLFKDVVI